MDFLALPAMTAAAATRGIGPSAVLFAVLAAIAVSSALGVVLMRNPLRSALCLVINFFTLAFLYFTLNAQLLGITQIVVYTGAIMVLFLFVIMLLNLGAPNALKEPPNTKKWLGLVFGAVLFGLVLAQVILPLKGVLMPFVVDPPGDTYGSPAAMGRTLFTAYVWPFEMASILLLVGIVGSILLAKRRM